MRCLPGGKGKGKGKKGGSSFTPSSLSPQSPSGTGARVKSRNES